LVFFDFVKKKLWQKRVKEQKCTNKKKRLQFILAVALLGKKKQKAG
jgi:hypothetical protein